VGGTIFKKETTITSKTNKVLLDLVNGTGIFEGDELARKVIQSMSKNAKKKLRRSVPEGRGSEKVTKLHLMEVNDNGKEAQVIG